MIGHLVSAYAVPATLVGLRTSGAVAAFLTSLLLAHTMDQAEMGRALTVLSLVVLAAILPSGGMEASVVRFVAKYREAEAPAKTKGILTITRLIWFWVSLILLLIAGLSFFLLDTETFVMVILFVGSVCLLSGLRVGATHAMAFGYVVRSQVPLIFLRQIGFLVVIFLVSSFGVQLSVQHILLAFFCAVLASFLVQCVLLRGILKPFKESAPDALDWREWFHYGLQMVPTLTFVQFSRDLILIVAAWSLAAENVAILAVTTAVIGFVKFGVVAINQSITPKLAKLLEAGKLSDVSRLIDQSNHMKFWPVLIIFVVLLFVGPSILGLFGPDFLIGAPILLIFMLEPLALASFGPAGQIISLSGDQRFLLPSALFAIASMVVFVTAGALLFGLAGAALGASLTWWVWAALLAKRVRKMSGLNTTIYATLRNMTQGRLK